VEVKPGEAVTIVVVARTVERFVKTVKEEKKEERRSKKK
jgi:hypothetical protein